MSVGNFVAVVGVEKNHLSLYNDKFQFRSKDTIVFVDEMLDNDAIELRGKLVPMIEVFDWGDTHEEYYTKEQFEKLGIGRKFEDFESKVVEQRVFKKQFPWFEKKTVEMCYVPNGHYSAPESERSTVSIKIPKEKFTIFDFRKDLEDK